MDGFGFPRPRMCELPMERKRKKGEGELRTWVCILLGYQGDGNETIFLVLYVLVDMYNTSCRTRQVKRSWRILKLIFVCVCGYRMGMECVKDERVYIFWSMYMSCGVV